MENYNILEKVNYSHNQNNACVLIRQFLIAQSNGQKILLLKMQNNFSQRINSVKYKIIQINSKGAEIQESIFEYNGFQASPNAIFVPYKSIILNKDCVDIKAELLEAKFDKYSFNKESIKEEPKETHSDTKVVNKVEPDFFIKERKPKIPKLLTVLISLFFVGISVSTFFAIEEYKNTHYEFSIDDFDYQFVNKTFSEDGDIILIKYNGKAQNVKIPSKVLEHNIIEIGRSAFSETDVSNIVIESELDTFKIDADAFKNCKNLKSVTFGKTSEIGDYAFEGCTSLESINLEGLTKIGKQAFSNSGIDTVNIKGDEPLSLGAEAFSYCGNLKEVIIEQEIDFNYSNSSFLKGSINVEKLSLVNCGSLDGKESYAVSNMFNSPYANLKELSIENVNSICNNFCKNLPIKSLKIGSLNDSVISEYAFYGCTNLQSISLPISIDAVNAYAFTNSAIESFDFSNVENIGEYAFFGTKITEAKLNSKIKYLAQGVFSGCENLSEVSIPTSMTAISDELFLNCSSLVNLDIDSNSINTIGNSSFAGCSSLSSFDLSNEISSIGENAFAGCSSLQSINIPVNITEIKEGTFADCYSLSQIVFDSSCNISSIGKKAFANCSSIETINLKQSTNLEYVGANAFSNCTKLKDIKFSDNCGLDEFNQGVFRNCNFESFVLPTSVNSIRPEAFEGCTNLTSFSFNNYISSIESRAFAGCQSLEKMYIPASVIYLGENVFENCTGLVDLAVPFASSNISEPSSLKYLFGSANTKDLGLETVSIYSASALKDFAFENFENLKSISLSDDLTRVGNGAFKNCKSLETLVLSANVVEIGSEILKGCDSLKELELPFIGYNENSPTTLNELYGLVYYSSNDVLESIKITNSKSLSDNALSYFTSLSDVKINTGLERIGQQAFYQCKSLESIIIPETVTYINPEIFSGCSSLKDITIPFIGRTDYSSSSLGYLFGDYSNEFSIDRIELTKPQIIGAFTFSNCKISEIVLGDSLLQIQNNAFYMVEGLKEITIPNSVESMEYGIFNGCNDLDSLTLPFIGYNKNSNFSLSDLLGWGNKEKIKNVEITDADSLESGVFADCIGLEKVVLNEGITTIPNYAFQSCYSLSEINIPESVTVIDNYAFANCQHLNEITIPSKIRTIRNEAFLNCNSLFSVRNYSSLNIQVGDYYNGCIAFYALEVINGDGESSITYYEQDNFKFLYYNDQWKLIKFYSDSNEVGFIDSFEYDGQQINQYEINKFLFYGKADIEKINIPISVTNIGESAFSNMKSLKEVNFDKDSPITALQFNLFSDDITLEKIELPTNLQSIYSSAFNNCQSIKSFTVNENISYIGDYAFSNCDYLYDILNLSSLDIKKGSTNHGGIASNALIVRTSLSQTPLQYIDIGDYGYAYGDDDLYIIKYLNGNNRVDITLPSSVTIENKTYNQYSLHNSAFNYSNIQSIHISDAVTNIGRNCFSQCYNLQKVTFGENVNLECIGEYAFQNCSNLKEFGNVKSLKKIEQYAFAWCDSLRSLPTFNNLEYIGNCAFYNCSSLRKIVLPETLSTIEYDAFYECRKLFEVINLSDNFNIEKGSTDFGYAGYYALVVINGSSDDAASIQHITVNGFEFINYLDETLLVSYESDNPLSEITLPETITINGNVIDSYEIANHAFRYQNFTKVTIPSSVTKIGNRAFDQCYSLQEVVFEDDSKLEIIGESAFSNCSSLTSIIIPSSVTTIENQAFASCNRLAEIVIGENVTSIGYNAFYANNSLSVIYNYSSLTFDSLNDNTYITKNVIKIYGKDKQYEKMKLYDDGNTLFGEIENEWYLLYYSNYSSMWILPSTIYYENQEINEYIIANDVCNYYYSLQSVVIPTSVIKICKNAFSYLYYFNTIYYSGNEQQWENIEIEDSSIRLKDIYYYSDCVHTDKQWTQNSYGNISTAVNYIEWSVTTLPTCSTKGEEVGYCNVCDKNVSRTIDMVAHEYENNACKNCGTTILVVDENIFNNLFENDSSYPFEITDDGVIYSTMKIPSSSATLLYVATKTEKISFEYKTSSESNCDILSIYTIIDSSYSQIAQSSGINSYVYGEVTLNAGDTIGFIYSKDGSVDSGDDCCYIKNFTIE